MINRTSSPCCIYILITSIFTSHIPFLVYHVKVASSPVLLTFLQQLVVFLRQIDKCKGGVTLKKYKNHQYGRVKWMAVTLMTLILLVVAGCSSGMEEAPYSGAMNNAASDGDLAVEEGAVDKIASDGGKTTTGISGQSSNQMVIYTANLTAEVTDYKKARNDLDSLIQKYQGYIVHSSEYENERERGGNITVRIPEGGFKSFLSEIEVIAHRVNNQSLQGQDVTEEYVDLESRLKAKKAVESRLLDFMNQAENVEDLLKISQDLGRVQEEIEQIEGRMRYLRDHTSFSTVHIQLIEKQIHVETPNRGTLNEAWIALLRSTSQLISLLTSAFVSLVGSLPYLVLLTGIALLGWYILRKVRQRQQKLENRSNQQQDDSDQQSDS